jgi:hypothetical protein
MQNKKHFLFSFPNVSTFGKAVCGKAQRMLQEQPKENR